MRQRTGRRATFSEVSGDFPIESEEYVVGNDNNNARISAAVVDATELDAGQVEFTVDVRYEALTEYGFEDTPEIIVFVDAEEAWSYQYGNTANDRLYSPDSHTFVEGVGEGTHEMCVQLNTIAAM